MRVLVVIFYLIFSFDSFLRYADPEENENSDVDIARARGHA